MKLTRHFALVLLFAALAGYAPARAQTAQEAYRMLENEQPGRARAAFSALLASSPTAVNAYYMADYYLAVGKPDSAQIYLQQAQTLDAKAPLVFVGLGELEIARGNLAAAKPQFDLAKRHSRSRVAEVFHHIGLAYMRHEQKDLGQAREALEKAVEIDGSNANVYATMGDLYMLQNDASKAALNYERAGYFDQQYARPHVRMGDIYVMARNYQEALRNYQNAVAADPSFAPAYSALGEIYFLAKQYDKAVENYGRYIELAGPKPESLFKYAGYLYLNNQFNESLEALRPLEGSFPNPVVYRLLAYSYHETDQHQPGLQAMQTFFEKAPAEDLLASDYETFGRLQLAAGGDTTAAIANLHQAIDADSSKTGIYRELATLLFNDRKYGLSAAEYETMSAKGMDLSATDYLNLGKAYYFDRNYIRADSAFAFVNAAATTSNTGWLWRARSSARAEAADSTIAPGMAKPHYEKYIELTTDTTKFKRELAEANFYLGLYHYRQAYGEEGTGTPEDKAQAEAYFKAVAALDPEYPNIQILLQDIAQRQ